MAYLLNEDQRLELAASAATLRNLGYPVGASKLEEIAGLSSSLEPESDPTPGPFSTRAIAILKEAAGDSADWSKYDKALLDIAYEADAMVARAAPPPSASLEALNLARQALTHRVPQDCWATGPSTGDAIEDYIVCPGCRAINAIDALSSPSTKATARPVEWCRDCGRTAKGGYADCANKDCRMKRARP